MPAGTDPARLVQSLSESFERTAREVVPWFISEMPPAYFTDTDEATRLRHLRAIIAARASGAPLRMTLRSDADSTYTFINERDYPGLLAEQTSELPTGRPLRQAKVHGVPGGKLVLDTFVLGDAPKFDPSDKELAQKIEKIIAHAEKEGVARDRIERHVTSAGAEYLRAVTPARALTTFRRFAEISGTDDSRVDLETHPGADHSRIVVMFGNVNPRRVFHRCAALFGVRGVDIRGAYLDVFDDGANGHVTMLTWIVQGPNQQAIDVNGALWSALRPELLRTKWISDAAVEFDRNNKGLGFLRAELVTTLLALTYHVLVRENPYAYARDRVFGMMKRSPQLLADLATLFIERFDPQGPLDDARFQARLQTIKDEIDRTVEGDAQKKVLATVANVVAATLRTNFFRLERYGLSLRIDPTLMPRPEGGETPYGVFFVHARGFDGFHVRFRDIARGGVRVVRPQSADQQLLELDRLYDEVYGLAQAQQYKNKDIPEGGAKGVMVAAPEISVQRAVKGFTDALLDLITPDPEVKAKVVDRFGKEEVIYLGPDENITPEIIEWIVDRARRRKYSMPNAFMSSKPGAGINHKEYGVTSEGVNVFLEVALKAVGIDPRKQPFTVKLTGGPDGDVGGNEIKILCREYGENAKIVGIADGSGSAEDPNGLDHTELLRLFKASLPIADFQPKALSKEGRVTPIGDPEGLKRRNTLHNRLYADAFIPAGGRPRAININNWQEYLLPDGRPSSRVIVEGANLFITPEARTKLGEKGVMVLKDSSANKCGVICSSFEIGASMILDTEEFLALKPKFVPEVLDKLRALAAREAETLFRERRRNPQMFLPEISVRLSKVMNRVADAIAAHLDRMSPADRKKAEVVVKRHLPKVLVETVGERINKMPPAYVRAIISGSLAADIVYREGLSFFDGLEADAIGDLAFRYLAETETVERLARELRGAKVPQSEVLLKIVERTGVRALVE